MRLEKSARNEIIETSPYFQTLLHHFWLTYFVKKKKKKKKIKKKFAVKWKKAAPLWLGRNLGDPSRKEY